MLMQIRERATGIFAYIIIILIAIPFAFWGIQEYFGGPADQKVAEVNGEEIPKRLFDARLQDQRRYLQSILGDSFNTLYKDESQLKNNVLEGLIQNALLGEETESAGYRISNNALAERIQSVPQFQENGVFSADRYEKLLAAQGRNPDRFERQLRQEESINQYQGSAVYSSFLPAPDKQHYAALKQQKRNFDYLLLAASPEQVKVSEEEIQAYYESNKSSFKTLERVKLEYLEIKQSELGAALIYGEDELLEAYNDDPTRFQSDELRKASHILFKLSEAATAEQFTAAFEKAKAVHKRIKNGEDFAALAEELSEDTFSAKNGGSLGYLARNDIDNPVFMDKLFSLKKGELSEPVKTSLGIQLVQLNDIQQPKTKSFDEVRAQIESELRAEASDKEFVERAEELSNLSYTNEDNLSVAAEQLGMQVSTSDWIVGAEPEGIASFPAVVSAAFSQDVLQKGLNSTLLELGDGHVMVLRMGEHEPAEVQALDAVTDQIVQTLTRSKAREQLIAKGDDIVSKLASDAESLSSVATALGASVKSAGDLLRDDDSVPAEIVEQVFSLSKAKDNRPLFNGVEMNDGRYAVIQLNKVIEVDTASAKVEQAEWISVEGRYGRREMSAMLKALRETGDVLVFPENL